MSDNDTSLNTRGLDNVLKVMKSKAYVRVGILGEKGVRGNGTSSKTPTNAEIGAFHEFGTSNVPKRSFLREPITELLDKTMKDVGVLEPSILKMIVNTASPTETLAKIGILAEGIVAGAFASGGYGKWAAWRAGYSNNTGNILVDTTQLRNSITSEVVE